MRNSGPKAAMLLGALALAATSIPAQAQLGNLFNSTRRGAEKADNCAKGKKGDTGRGALGGLLGGAVDEVARGVGLPSFLPVPEFSDQLAESIACKLDPEEQKQAAEATLAVTRADGEAAPEVGASASWTSATRENVSGTSTVTSREASSGSADCITVTDVVIIEGEEARAEKRMCKAPGSARYSIVA